MAGYLPSTLLGLKDWANNFQTKVAADFAELSIPEALSDALTAAYTAFAAALVLSTNPATRTPTKVAATQEKKLDLLDLIYQAVPLAQATPDITPEVLTGLGLTVRKTTRTPVPTPTNIPVLAAQSLVSLQTTLRLKDLDNDSNRFPPNVVGANIYMKISATPPASIADCVFVGRATKRFFVQIFDGADANKAVHFIAAYVTRTNKEGASSSVLSTTVPM